jgi:biotin-dependent carboxylase-like uncharacterized protein
LSSTNPVLEVLAPGMQTTVQDAGRPDLGHLGVPLSGACDAWSFDVANALVGNEPGAAALELTIAGPELRTVTDCVVGLAGADLGGLIVDTGRRLVPGRSHRVPAGVTISFPAPLAAGARAYLALPGGLDVPLALGSRSTCLAAGFGGLEGRPLRAGDRLACLRAADAAPEGRTWPSDVGDQPIRVLSGPDPAELDDLLAQAWTVAAESDRMGLRLDGDHIAGGGHAGQRRTHGIVPGTIQRPPDGRPIVLLADAQPTGGYPIPAVVATADLPRLGQLRPGGELRFELVDRPAARRALLDRRAAWERGVRNLVAGADWDELWRSARG